MPVSSFHVTPGLVLSQRVFGGIEVMPLVLLVTYLPTLLSRGVDGVGLIKGSSCGLQVRRIKEKKALPL